MLLISAPGDNSTDTLKSPRKEQSQSIPENSSLSKNPQMRLEQRPKSRVQVNSESFVLNSILRGKYRTEVLKY